MSFFSRKSQKAPDKCKDGTPSKILPNGSSATKSTPPLSHSTSQQFKSTDSQSKAGFHSSKGESERSQYSSVDRRANSGTGVSRLDSFTNPEMGDLSSSSVSGPTTREPEIRGSWSSQLWKGLAQVLVDKDALAYLIQFLESRGAVSLVKFWLDAETFRLLNDSPAGAPATAATAGSAPSAPASATMVTASNSNSAAAAAAAASSSTAVAAASSSTAAAAAAASSSTAATAAACPSAAAASDLTSNTVTVSSTTVSSTKSKHSIVENLGHCDTLSADLQTSLHISSSSSSSESNPVSSSQTGECLPQTQRELESSLPNISPPSVTGTVDAFSEHKKPVMGNSSSESSMKLEGGAYQRIGGASVIAHGDCESRLDSLPALIQSSNAGTGMFDTGVAGFKTGDSASGCLGAPSALADPGSIPLPAGEIGKYDPGMVVPSNMGVKEGGFGTDSKGAEAVTYHVPSSNSEELDNNSSCEKNTTKTGKNSLSDRKITQGSSESDARSHEDVRTSNKGNCDIGAPSEEDIAVVEAAETGRCGDVNKTDNSISESSVVVPEITRSCTSDGIPSKENVREEKPRSRNPSERQTRTSVERDAVVIFSKYLSPDCSHPITISEPLRAETIRRICCEDGRVDPRCFVECQRAVYEIIDTLYYADYLSSVYHTKHQVDLLTGTAQLHLTDILYHDTSLGYFTEFMEAENLLPVLQCFLDLDNFEKHLLSQSAATSFVKNSPPSSPKSSGSTVGYDGMEAQSDAIVIYEKYFSLQATSTFLRFDDKVRLEIENQICREGGPLPNCFGLPRALIYSKIEQVYFPRFLKSEQYYKYLSDLINAVRQAPDDLLPYRRKRTGSDASSERSFGSQHSSSIGGGINTLLAMDTRGHHGKGQAPSTKVSHDVDMRMDDAMFNPDNLWRRATKPTGMNIGRVDDLGQFISEFDPAPDQDKLDFGRLFGKKKLGGKERENEEMALQVAQRIISDVACSASALTDDDDWSAT